MPVTKAIVSHDQKGHVTHFDCLDVRNILVTLTVGMALCDVNISANGMT